MVNFELFDEVGTDITIDQVRSFLNANKSEDINFQIASLGGNLGVGLLIHDLIKSHPGKTTAEIIGHTASAATVIAMGCDEVVMNENALFLIHNGWMSAEGNKYDLQKIASNLEKNDAIMTKIYRNKTGLKDDQITSLMKAEDWMSASEAFEMGFVDRVESSIMQIAASIYSRQKKLLSESIINKLQNKMDLFKSKKKDGKINILALADGNNVVINAEEAEKGVEIVPVGAMTLEDGEFELADGRKIVVAGGVITDVTEVEPEAGTELDVDAVVDAVGDVVAKAINEVEAKLNAKIEALKVSGSSHTPDKGKGADNSKKEFATPHAKIKEITNGVFDKIKKDRMGA